MRQNLNVFFVFLKLHKTLAVTIMVGNYSLILHDNIRIDYTAIVAIEVGIAINYELSSITQVRIPCSCESFVAIVLL